MAFTIHIRSNYKVKIVLLSIANSSNSIYLNQPVEHSPNYTSTAKEVIVLLQNHIHSLGYRAVIHFELEGCYQSDNSNSFNFEQANKELDKLGVEGELVAEYWQNQWEYVSKFLGQSPLKEAHNLQLVIEKLPDIFAIQGISNTLITPVVWSGDIGKLAQGSKNIFTHEQRSVHIPNAIQMNVSISDLDGRNLMSDNFLGERLQQSFIQTSRQCSLIYLPEELAFARFDLKSKFGLVDELCSPTDISGGNQGSVALYKDKGKHNQPMGENPLLYDQFHQVIRSESDWRKTARIEHRLGASSRFYNAHLNVIFALLNIINTVTPDKALQEYKQNTNNHINEKLPISLHSNLHQKGAIDLFLEDSWFAESIDIIEKYSLKQEVNLVGNQKQKMIGSQLKSAIIAQYEKPTIITTL